jgi:predicted dehydrogenase
MIMSTHLPSVSRRRFLAGAGALAATFQIVLRHVLGGPGYTAPSEKITTAFIGVGSQGLRVMLDFLKQPDVQAVAVCDPNRGSGDYPQWSRNEFTGAVNRLLGVSNGWDWLSPNQPVPLSRSFTATGGMAGREPCQKIVDAWNGREKGSGTSRGCNAYADFRELLAQEKDLDAVVVGSADHVHASISIAAMRLGKHVYCQKPMAHTVHEARTMAEVAAETKVATQVAVMNSESEDTRRISEWIEAGGIGRVREVQNWSSRPVWPQGIARPANAQPVPDGLDWDLWLGPAPERPFHHDYLPFVWRGWHDFGSGALGDMGQYSFDTIFRALKLQAPSSVETSSTERFPESFPRGSIVHYEFPARGDQPSLRVTWYDGGLKPPRPEQLGTDQNLSAEGLLFLGDQGAILCDFNGRNPRLLPESRRKEFQEPPKTLPRSPGNYREWLDACKGGTAKPGASFEFSAPVVETLLLGNISLLNGRRLAWDAPALTITNDPAAQKAINPERRSGWEL